MTSRLALCGPEGSPRFHSRYSLAKHVQEHGPHLTPGWHRLENVIQRLMRWEKVGILPRWSAGGAEGYLELVRTICELKRVGLTGPRIRSALRGVTGLSYYPGSNGPAGNPRTRREWITIEEAASLWAVDGAAAYRRVLHLPLWAVRLVVNHDRMVFSYEVDREIVLALKRSFGSRL